MIAVDAMGGDYAPQAVVQGAYQAAKQGIEVLLFGNYTLLTELLYDLDPHWQRLSLHIVDCHEVVHMDDKPTQALVHKKNASLFGAIRAVAQGQADGVVSAGNSGAMLVGAITYLKRIPGLVRPALATFLPTVSGAVLVLDLGANVDCKPIYLHQFGLMASLFLEQNKSVERPRIALISNGHEEGKGSALVQQAYTLLANDKNLNFVGNIEPRDMFQGTVDIVVCDGFVGNVLLKTVQGTSQTLLGWMNEVYHRTWYTKLIGLCTKRILRPLYKRIDYKNHPGALLLGVQYPCIVAHGSSSAISIERSIVYAQRVAQEQSILKLNQALTQKLSFSEDTAVDTLYPEAEPRADAPCEF